MSEFYVGQEVVCIDDDFTPGRYHASRRYWISRGEVFPRAGVHYHIREFVDDGDDACVRLIEIINKTLLYKFDGGVVRHWEPSFKLSRFRPINPNAIAIFRQMCVDAPKYAKKVGTP